MFLGRVMRTAGLAAGIFAFGVFANPSTTLPRLRSGQVGTSAGEEEEKQLSKKDVPASVLAAFEKAYPKAVVKGYSREEKDGKTLYEVESMEGKIHRDVTFLEDGSWVVTEEVVAAKNLPVAVRQAVIKGHPKGKIELAEKITEGAAVSYEVVVAEGKKKVEIKLDKSGKVLESEEAGQAE